MSTNFSAAGFNIHFANGDEQCPRALRSTPRVKSDEAIFRVNLAWVLAGSASLCAMAGYRIYRRLARTPALSEKACNSG